MNPKVLAPLLITVFVLASGPCLADDDHHQREYLNAAVRKGEILQLSEILERVRPQIDGKILEIEFEYEKHKPVYEIYVLDHSGRRIEYEVDARTATIISLEDDH